MKKRWVALAAVVASVAGFVMMQRYRAQREVAAKLDEAAEEVTAFAASAAVHVADAADAVAARTTAAADHAAVAASDAAFSAAMAVGDGRPADDVVDSEPGSDAAPEAGDGHESALAEGEDDAMAPSEEFRDAS